MGRTPTTRNRYVRATLVSLALALTASACASSRAPLDREAFVLRIQERGYTPDQSNCIANRIISVYGDQMYADGQIAASNPAQVERYVRAYSESC